VGIYDRPYWREPPPRRAGGGGMFVGMPRPAKAVKIMLMINIGVYVAQALTGDAIADALGATAGQWWQPWRYVTFQFLHGGVWHLGLNMLGLYMLGSPLEQQWGTRRFLAFYLSCGALAGAAYVIMGHALGPSRLPSDIPLVGASGGVYAIVLACAVLFPQFKLIFFLFPVPIRMAALIIFGGMVLMILSSLSSGQIRPQFWSDVAHLGGAAGGAFWIWVLPRLVLRSTSARVHVRKGAWARKTARGAAEDRTIDEILKKIHDQGINNLTDREKKTLAEATKQQRQRGD